MQKLFILKNIDGAEHVIGRLIKTDDGVFGVEDLLAEPGSEKLGIPVFTNPGENNEKLMNWVVSFMPPVGNNHFMKMLVAALDVDEFDPWEWLKQYKPGGRNIISFCEKIPFGCVVHCSNLRPQDFADLTKPLYEYVDFDSDDEPFFGDCLIPRSNYFNGDYDSFFDNDYLDECEDYYEDEEDDDDEWEDIEPTPIIIDRRKQCGSLPVFPENIPQERQATDFKEFVKMQEHSKLSDLRTVHNTLCSLTKISVTDFAVSSDIGAIAAQAKLSDEAVKKITLGDIVKRCGYLVNEHSDIPQNYYTGEHADLFGLLSRNIRAIASRRNITL